MKLDVRYNNHPEDSKSYDTEMLRKRYLIERVFVKDELSLTYSHHDRIIAGGAFPVDKEVSLGLTKELGTEYFLERREMRSEEHTSELQSRPHLVCRLLLEKKKQKLNSNARTRFMQK